MQPQLTTAKIIRPKIAGIYPRTRLFRTLDSGPRISWVSAPAGSGKTTLMASYLDARKLPCIWYSVDPGDADIATFFFYLGNAVQKAAPRYRKPLPLLTPEYLQGLATFTANYFENLFLRLKPPFVIVLDNYQEAPEQSHFHAIVNSAMSLIPEGIHIVVLSRNEPPPAFSRLRANATMKSIGWNDLRFTVEESKQIIQRNHKLKLTRHAMEELHKKTEGWAAGLVLLMEGAGTAAGEPQSTGTFDPKIVFDYFAEEVFDKLDRETREFLLMTASLPRMTVNAAERMTDHENAGRILAALNRNHFFTEKHKAARETYQYHPLFREFLLRRMKGALNAEGLVRMQKRAASTLEEEGQIEDAVSLYQEARDWEKLIPLVLGNAQSMMMQGRSTTLKGWLDSMPREVLDSMPWLLYWSGMCHMGCDLAVAQEHFKQAFRLFTDSNDGFGMALSWSFIIMAIFYEWNDFHQIDKWIATYFDQVEKLIQATPPEIQARAMTAIGLALTIRTPDHPRTAEFIESSMVCAVQSRDMDSCSAAFMGANIYYSWIGDHARSAALAEQVRRSASSRISLPNQHIAGVLFSARYLWDASDIDKADKRISEALEFGATTGIHLMDNFLYACGASTSLMKGEMSRAEQYLEKMGETLIPSRKEMHVQYHMMNASYHFLRGNLSSALRDAETALRFSEETGYIFARILQLHAISQITHALNDDKADEYIERALDLAIRSRSRILEFGCRLAQAQFALESGKEKTGVGLLRECLSLGKKHEYYLLLWWWDPAAMARIAVKALEEGIETEYVRNLIRIRKLSPDEPPVHVADWPWPLKIYTLGAFRIEKDGKPVTFSGRVQQKPLLMLKALIALGGEDVPEESLTDLLWPESEGDAAASAFSTTLQRVRNIVGQEKVLLLREGRLSLDPQYCWADVRAFEFAAEQAEAAWNTEGSIDEALRLSRRATELYKGHFLPAENGLAWTVSYRERLKSKFFRIIMKTGSHLEEARAWDEALAGYERALEIDDLAESVYRRIMRCYQQLGRIAEAVSVYQRCRAVLAATIGIKPSEETEALYASLRSR